MNLEKYLQEECILLVRSSKKQNLLQQLSHYNGLNSVKIIPFEEMKKYLFFDYDERTLFYLVSHKHCKVELAKIYLENLYYIEEKEYSSKKLNELVSLKRELNEQKLLIYSSHWKRILSRKKVIVLDSNDLSDLERKIVKVLKEITVVEELPVLDIDQKQKTVYEFGTLEEEVRFVIYEMLDLYQKGVSFSKMHLLNVTSEYETVLPRLLRFYEIPFQSQSRHTLFATVTGQKVLTKLKDNLSFVEIIDFLKEENAEFISQIIDIFNRYIWYSGLSEELYSLIEQELKTTTIPNPKIKDGVTFDSMYQDYSNDDYCFLLGFNQENLPKTYKDEDYITDLEKVELGLDSALEKNKLEKRRLQQFLYQVPNLTVTYKLKSSFLSFYPSSMIEEEQFQLEKKQLPSIIYSDIDQKLCYTKKLDSFMKYGTKDHELQLYRNHFSALSYLTYDNQYTGIHKDSFYQFINQKLLLSYSSIDQFYRCGFRYYAGQVLKLEEYENTFAQMIGTIFHEILSIAFEKDFSLDGAFSQQLEGKTFSKKESFFLKKLKEELRFVIDTIREQTNLSCFRQALYEKKIFMNKDRNIKVTFMGIVDKILYQEKDGMTYVAIIDYKTGTPQTNISNTIYGIEMQLPIYLYLVKESHLFENVKFTGFYLQKILNNEISIQKNKTYEEIKKERLKLAGYSSDQEYLVEKVDVNYANSNVIQGMKLTQKGFAHYSKVMSEEDMNQLVSLVDEKIEQAITDILEVRFLINPKKIGFKDLGCEFCPFRELCYKNDKNIVYLKEYQGLDFLGGEEDA